MTDADRVNSFDGKPARHWRAEIGLEVEEIKHALARLEDEKNESQKTTGESK